MTIRPADAITMWPARVTLADGTHHPVARIDTTAAGVRVWVWADGTAVLAATIDRASLSRDGRAWVGEGQTRIERGRGCGCGHPLARFRPERAEVG